MPDDQGKGAKPLTTEEIENFLVEKDHKSCPWCGGKEWGFHVFNEGTLLGGTTVPGLRALPKLTLKQKEEASNALAATVHTGTESVLGMAAAECQECGHLTFFNYFTLMRLIRSKKAI